MHLYTYIHICAYTHVHTREPGPWRFEAPGLEMTTLNKEVNRKMVGSQGGARIEKSSPGGARAGNDDFE